MSDQTERAQKTVIDRPKFTACGYYTLNQN